MTRREAACAAGPPPDVVGRGPAKKLKLMPPILSKRINLIVKIEEGCQLSHRLLQEPNFQRLYFYTQELFYLLRKVYSDIRFNLMAPDPAQINLILAQLAPLVDLPAAIYTRPLIKDFGQFWAGDYLPHQMRAIKTLKTKLHYGRGCHSYLVAPILQPSKTKGRPAKPRPASRNLRHLEDR